MMGVWMVLMSHNEPLHNHNTHQVCLPAFHSLLSILIHNHKWCSCDGIFSMVCSAIQPIACAIHLSLQHIHTLTLASHHNRHTPCWKCHQSKCQTPKHSHGKGQSADACTQGQGRGAECIGCCWIAWQLHERQWGVDTVPQMTC